MTANLLVFASVVVASDTPKPPEKVAIPRPSYGRMHPSAKDYLELMRETVRRSPDSAGAWDSFGVACHSYQLLDCAETCYREAHRLAPKQFFYIYHLVLALDGKGGGGQELVGLCELALSLRPSYMPAHWRLGKALEKVGKLDTALAAFTRMTQIAPQSPYGYKGAGEVLLKLGMTNKAISHFEKAVASAPDDGGAYASLAKAYRRLGETVRADHFQRQADAKETVETMEDPIYDGIFTRRQSAKKTLARAKQSVGMGNYEEAIADLMLVLEVSQEDLLAHVLLATCFRATNDLEKAQKHAVKALQLDASSMSAHLELAAIYIKLGDLDLGLEHYVRAQGLDPQNGKIDTWVADILLQAGHIEHSITAYERAAQYDALDANAHWKWGLALGEQGKIAGAINHFASAIEMDPSFTNAYYSLGMAYEKLGRPKRAVEQYRIAVELNPKHIAGTRLKRLETESP